MTAVIFALPEESRAFRRTVLAKTVQVVHSGVGPAAAHAAISQVLASGKPELVICGGFAGALDPALRVGDVLLAENYTTVELDHPATVQRGTLLSLDHPVEGVAEKAGLFRQTGARAVDMETAAIAAECSRAGVPLLVLRAISDAATDALPVPFAIWFDTSRQRPRPMRLLAHLARHPARIASFARFVRGLRPARTALSHAIVSALEIASHDRSGMKSMPV